MCIMKCYCSFVHVEYNDPMKDCMNRARSTRKGGWVALHWNRAYI